MKELSAEIVSEIQRQVDWRAPGMGKTQGHVVLKRTDAVTLLAWIKEQQAVSSTQKEEPPK